MSTQPTQTSILAMAGALRSGSLNRKLIAVAAQKASQLGADVKLVDLRDYGIPVYDGDAEEAHGIPAGVAELAAEIQLRDALMICSPEYNFSVSGVIKNTVDWLSRVRPMVLKGKSAFLLSASPSLVGGNRGLWHLRVPLESLGVHVYPGMFSLASANQAFDEHEALVDPAMDSRLHSTLESFITHLAALKG